MDKVHLTYLDFELEIGPGQGREYPVAVVRSPAGEACETLRFPYDELALENHLDKLQIALLRSGGRRRQIPSPEEKTVQDFGRSLFDALLTGEVRNRYDVSQSEAANRHKGLRLKLRIQPPELAALPWEFLYDSRQAEYVCLSRSTPLVRYLELPQPIVPLAVEPPLCILGMIASPQDLPPLDVGRETQRVERAIKDLQAKGLVNLTWIEGQTWRDLQQAIWGGPWHIFHFIGHGGFDRNADEGFVALADKEGETQRLSATQLGRLLADHPSLRLALLNACEGARGSRHDVFSSTASLLVRRGLPAVLAMQNEISDRAAIEFATTFYTALADGLPVDAAVAEARKAVSLALNETVEWGTPVLYMRAPDGLLFEVGKLEDRPHDEVVPPGPHNARQEGKSVWLEVALGPEPRPEPEGRKKSAEAVWSRVRRWPRLPVLTGLLVLVLLVGVAIAWRGGDGGRSIPTPTPAVRVVTAQPTPTPTLGVTSRLSTATSTLPLPSTAKPKPTATLVPTRAPRATSTLPLPSSAKPKPTATLVPTPAPTATPTRKPPTATPELPSPTPIPTPCPQPIAGIFADWLASKADLAPLVGCPRGQEIQVAAVREPFERGQMLWRSDRHQIYVLPQTGNWTVHDDEWQEGDPESDASIVPGPGLYQPIRGFGLLWRQAPGVRDALGWATAPESIFEATVQPFQGGIFIADGMASHMWVLLTDGAWLEGP